MSHGGSVVTTAVERLLGVAVSAVRPVPGGDVCRAYRARLGDGREFFAKTRDGRRRASSPRRPPGCGCWPRRQGLPCRRCWASTTRRSSWSGCRPARRPRPLPSGSAVSWRRGTARLRRARGADARLDRRPAAGQHPRRHLAAVLRRAPGRAVPRPGGRPGRDRPGRRTRRGARARAARPAGGPAGAARHGPRGPLDRQRALGRGRPRPAGRPRVDGGHRETDLAMLALFGAPLLERVLAACAEAAPLAPGWGQRAPLHQLHPLLVHAVLFGGGYGARAGRTARAALRA
nr:fructosamine kinase family protein [Motilibacter aurantiacus]